MNQDNRNMGISMVVRFNNPVLMDILKQHDVQFVNHFSQGYDFNYQRKSNGFELGDSIENKTDFVYALFEFIEGLIQEGDMDMNGDTTILFEDLLAHQDEIVQALTYGEYELNVSAPTDYYRAGEDDFEDQYPDRLYDEAEWVYRKINYRFKYIDGEPVEDYQDEFHFEFYEQDDQLIS